MVSLVLVSVPVLLSPSVFPDNIMLGLGREVVTFWERAAHSVYRMFFFILTEL